ncbi:MAG: hypothetical protein IIA67_01965, partial [Planctomycetes bacterium]|nr:hypothetical protein [Planctomycetota bacterium]
AARMTVPSHLKALIAFNGSGVDYILIGALALDHYVREGAAVYATVDCDILVRPTAVHARRAYRSILRSGFTLRVGDEPIVEIDAVESHRESFERRIAVEIGYNGDVVT